MALMRIAEWPQAAGRRGGRDEQRLQKQPCRNGNDACRVCAALLTIGGRRQVLAGLA